MLINCKRCGRKIKSENSINGYGKTCFKKTFGNKVKKYKYKVEYIKTLF